MVTSLELKRFAGGGRFTDEPDQFFKVWPLQIVFHNIGWYLGYEIAAGPNAGLLEFERLDRLFRGHPRLRIASLGTTTESIL